VQKFSIRASLERFNLPDSFIRYVESYLEEATSCFPVLTSVRQIIITDATHTKDSNTVPSEAKTLEVTDS